MTTAVFASAGMRRFYHFLRRSRSERLPAASTIGPWPRHWSPAAAVSSARTSSARWPSVATTCACCSRRGSGLDHLSDLDFERSSGDVMDRRAVRAGRWRASIGSFTSPAAPRCARQHRDKVFDLNVKGTRIVLEEASPRTSRAGRSPPRSPRSAPPGRAARPTRRSRFAPGSLGITYVNSKHEAEVEALRLAAHGLPVVIVNPSFVLGPDDPKGHVDGAGAPIPPGPHPGLRRRGLNIVDVRDVAAGHLLADEKGETGERYILAGAQLHARPPVRRHGPPLGPRTCPGEAPGSIRPSSRSS